MTNQATQETKSLVLIIGAGASAEVGLPIGKELKISISEALNIQNDTMGNLTGGEKLIRDALNLLAQQYGNISHYELQDYIAAAKLIHDAMPQALSIDNFIDSHKKNGRVATCGKLAIVSSILKAEKNSKLYVESNTLNTINFTEVSNTWFNTLFQMISKYTQEDDIEAQFEKISIISFNYDRCLEHFLHCSLQNYYGMDQKKAFNLVKKLKIHHPYGKVANLPSNEWATEIGYGNSAQTGGRLKDIAMSFIKTFTEETEKDSSDINEIRSTVKNAKRIAFLGFAYDDLNLKLLYGQNNDHPIKSETKVYGTAYGISESNRNYIIGELIQLGGYDPRNIKIEHLTASQLLDDYSRALAI